MGRDLSSKVVLPAAPGKRKTLKEPPAHPKDAYTHHTSVNGNMDTRRKPVKKAKKTK